jgi:hypothetical protein
MPYMTGEYIMDTYRLQNFLGAEYQDIMRYAIEDAFADSFKRASGTAAHEASAS